MVTFVVWIAVETGGKDEAEFWKQDVEKIDREENILASERK
jgi:hypothetical protein